MFVRKKTKWRVKGKWCRLTIFFFLWSELIQDQFYFSFIFLFDPSWTESIRVDPTRSGGPRLIRSDFCMYLCNASVNSTCAQPPPLGWSPGINIFFPLDGKFWGLGTLELSNTLGWGRKKRANAPALLQHCNLFSLIAQSNTAILSILMCDFLFQ